MNHLTILHYLFRIRALLNDSEKSIEKIRDYDRHNSRSCVDLFLKVIRSNILTIIINRDEIFDYVIFV
jgi:predicted house-cleaning noncanonical NTP pyrophosphatase (MazG superfamily)